MRVVMKSWSVLAGRFPLSCVIAASVLACLAAVILTHKGCDHQRGSSDAALSGAPTIQGQSMAEPEAGVPESLINETPFRPAEEKWEGKAVSDLLDTLEQGDDLGREQAAEALGFVFHGREHVPDLRTFGTPRNVRLRTLAVVKERGPGLRAKAIVSVLIRALDDGTSQVRGAAAHSLMTIGPEAIAACTRLRSALKDEDPKVRGWAARALYFVAHDVVYAVDANVGLLENADAAIRQMACYNLHLMDEDGYPSIPFLEKRLSDPIWDVQQQASVAIRSILAAQAGQPRKR